MRVTQGVMQQYFRSEMENREFVKYKDYGSIMFYQNKHKLFYFCISYLTYKPQKKDEIY